MTRPRPPLAIECQGQPVIADGVVKLLARLLVARAQRRLAAKPNNVTELVEMIKKVESAKRDRLN